MSADLAAPEPMSLPIITYLYTRTSMTRSMSVQASSDHATTPETRPDGQAVAFYSIIHKLLILSDKVL